MKVVVIDGGKDAKPIYAQYTNGVKALKVESERALEPGEIEAFRKDPHGYVYGETEAQPA